MRLERLSFVLILIIYCVAAFGIALTKAPFCDEGWLASPGLNLLRHGHMETSLIEPAGSFLVGIDHYTYWVMPLWLLASAVFYKLFGFGLTTLRSLSLLWGAIGICACFAIGRKLTGKSSTAVLACAILACDTNFILNGAAGRMDMMSAVCGLSGIAVYLWMRERDLTRAVIASHSLVAAGVFSHPNGIVAFLCLCFLTVYLDFSKIRWFHLGVAAAPYLAGMAAWGWYISYDPHAFVSQFAGNASPASRGLVFHAPFAALKLEVTKRYLDGYSFYSPGLKKLRVVPLPLYLVSFIGCVCTPGIRRNRYLRAALLLCVVSVSALFLVDGIKRSFYLVHVLVPLALVSSIWITWIWDRWRRARLPLALALASVYMIQLGGIVTLIRKHDRLREFQPMIAFLNQHRRPDTVIMGPSELGFALGYNPPLVDDYRLGYFSGKHAQYVVVDDNYRALINDLKTDNPPVYRSVTDRLAHEYHPVWQDGLYQILGENDGR